MTFGALPYEERDAKAALASRLKVGGIPSLMIFGPRPAGGGDRPLINGSVRRVIVGGDYLSDFPFAPKPYGDLNAASENINSFRCVIVFHESGDEEGQENIQRSLEAASKLCDDKNMRWYWANAPSGLSKSVREALQLGPVKDEPSMVLMDIPDQGAYYVSELSDVSVDSMVAFIACPGERRQV